ncbi:unnamed protein product [Anisakis simplex]|uniref:Spindle pole body component n=2 Tax=Anisakis simplex TaxID=6269 RepID=A0A0M3KK06_ANISI|nr:unnamed protein product [Anisakis simplex]
MADAFTDVSDVFFYRGVSEPNDDMFAMKLRYEPLFPLQIVFTTSSMDTFYEIWTLRSTLAIELAHLEKLEFDEILMSWHFMLMRSRMMSFLNTLQMFLQTQIDHVLATASLKGELLNSETLDEAHEALK